MFNPSAFWNSRPDGFPVLEVVADEGGEESPGTGHPRQFVALRRSVLTGTVAGPVASLTLTQKFGYTRTECDRVLEAVYRFPLPGDAAVTGVAIRFGDAEIRAELKERAEAEAEYETAKAEGRQAALTTRESPDVFTLRVAGIEPDQEVTVATEHVVLAREERDGRRSLRVPLTTAPRYVRGDESNSPHAAGQPLALLRDPGHRFALDLVFTGGAEVSSRTHALTSTATADGGTRVTLKDGEVLPDRDCVLMYRPAAGLAANGSTSALRAYVHHAGEGDAATSYVLAEVVAPAQPVRATPAPREVVLLVDRSGSMSGAKWEAADWAVKQFLASLTDQDFFALGLFHDSTHWLASGAPQAADGRAINKAQRFLEDRKDSGGTELGVALEQALRLLTVRAGSGNNDGISRHVLIVTDAEVSDAGRLLRLAEAEAAKSPDVRRRVSVLCIDAAPNSLLAYELAERGGGVARFLTSRPEEEDITTALEEVLAEWSAPEYVGVRLRLDSAGVQAAGRSTAPDGEGGTEVDLGDLAAGRTRSVALRLPTGSAGGATTLTLMAGYGRQERALGAPLRVDTAQQAPNPAVKALFGARRLLTLEHLLTGDYFGESLEAALKRLGYPSDALQMGAADAPLYAENRRAEAGDGIRRLLVRESLEFGLTCSATAFVAVRSEAGKLVEGTAVVANALPAGWSDTFLGGPPTGAYAAAAMPLMAAAPMLTGVANVKRQRSFAPPPPPMARPAAPGSGGGGLGNVVRSLFRGGGASGAKDQSKAQSFDLMAEVADDEGGAEEESVRTQARPTFSGVPTFANGEAVLLDTRSTPEAVPGSVTLTRLTVRFPDGVPSALDAGLTLMLYVDDLARPRATVRLADLIRQGGTRPLNVLRNAGAVVLLVLGDENGVWANGTPLRLEVVLE